nr:ISAs1 family transposase [Romeriopsis navalis]
MGALKGNHGRFFEAVQQQFQAETHCHHIETGHGRVERRTVSPWQSLESLPDAADWPGLKTIIRVTSDRHLHQGDKLLIQRPQMRYFISSLDESVECFAQRIRDYWHIENKVHYVRDVTQGEDASRIRVQPLPNLWAIARNLALNLYRDAGFQNMAQAKRKCGFGLNQLELLFRMK